MWDVYLAFIILLFWTTFYKVRFLQTKEVVLALTAFIGLEADILFRIFLLVPARGYSIFYGLTPEVLAAIWAVPAPLITPIKVLVAVFLTVILVTKISNIFNDFNLSEYSF
jgi:hypothetical protein